MQREEGCGTKINRIWMTPGHVFASWINLNVHTAVQKHRPPLHMELEKHDVLVLHRLKKSCSVGTLDAEIISFLF